MDKKRKQELLEEIKLTNKKIKNREWGLKLLEEYLEKKDFSKTITKFWEEHHDYIKLRNEVNAEISIRAGKQDLLVQQNALKGYTNQLRL